MQPTRFLAAGFAVDRFLKPPNFETQSGMISAIPKLVPIQLEPDEKRHDPVLGERRLWAAVLQQALSDLHPRTDTGANTPEKVQRLREETLYWFNSTTFEAICEILDLKHEPIRRKVQNMSRYIHRIK